MEPGVVEVVASANEQIGLPNWSHVNLLVSAKGNVPVGQEDAGFNYLFSHALLFTKDSSERIAKSLSMFYEVAYKPDRIEIPAPIPQSADLFAGSVEVVFSMTEQISLPTDDKGKNSSIRLMASSKMIVMASSTDQGFAYLAEVVRKQMGEKRQMVLDNPRPWLIAQGA